MYVIASSRPWNLGMCQRLGERTGQQFELIQHPDALKAELLSAARIHKLFFPHWSHKIPAEIYESFECVIFHMTDLPYGRGGSPLQNLIVRGHENTVITALRCVERMDAGPVYLKRPLNLNGSAEEIYLRADRTIESMIVTLITEQPEPVPQSGEATLFRRRRPEEGDWSYAKDLDSVFNHIRMLDATGYPPAFVDVGPFRLEFSRAARRTDAVQADVRITLRHRGDKNA
jgi:methionyl-tRNA formyltransferase